MTVDRAPATQPLISTTSTPSTHNVTSFKMCLLTLNTFALIWIGLSQIMATTLLPVLVADTIKIVAQRPRSGQVTAIICTLQILHVQLLWRSAWYLACCRMLWWPLRKVTVPLVMLAARFESIKDGEPVAYAMPYTVSAEPGNDDKKTTDEATLPALMRAFPGKLRSQYKRRERFYRASRIQHAAVRADNRLRLCDAVPIIWEHQIYCCLGRSFADAVAEFVKRFLVVTCVPDGVLDLYYQPTENDRDRRLVAVCLSFQQGKNSHGSTPTAVWHSFMYFSLRHASSIWFHQALISMLRGQSLEAFTNSQTHATESKRQAGYYITDTGDESARMLDNLYPWRFSVPPHDSLLRIEVWH